ncbi:hypothetical protein RA268_29735, partial [Pseudomonas syringae pv. tagetis]
LYVYRDLSDPELEELSTFAESPEAKAYYQSALSAIRAGLAVAQRASSLNPGQKNRPISQAPQAN